MGADVFDQVARDYERIHNRSLPPGVRSDEFVAQKAEQLVAWLGAAYRGRELRYLDFGCGNGRLFRYLLESPGLRPLDFVISCNVFHHIPPAERDAVVDRLAAWAEPGARLVIWEHNPLNPFARLIVRICPFDREARLVTLPAARRLFGRRFRYRRHAYVNLFPPGLQRVAPLRRVEERLARVPVGAQYWVMFEAP